MIDAIIYRSAQNGSGKNISIFGGAAVVTDNSDTNRNHHLSGKPALKVAVGSLASYEVSGVIHEKHETYTPDPQPEKEEEEDNFISPF